MTIKQAILSVVKDHIKPTIYVGKVKSVDETKLVCDIDLQTQPDVYDVRIKAAIDNVAKGILIIPKVDSIVLIAAIEGQITSSVIIAYTEVQSINWVCDDIKLNGDSNGGLVISQKVSDEDNAIKNEINNLKSIFSTWAPVPNDGGAALKGAISSWASGQMSIKQPSDYESQKVKHGA